MKPTKARIELMQAISDGAVTEHSPLTGGPLYSLHDLGPGATPRRYRRVTAAMRALYLDDYATMRPARLGDFSARLWSLTPAGEAWLKANGGSTS